MGSDMELFMASLMAVVLIVILWILMLKADSGCTFVLKDINNKLDTIKEQLDTLLLRSQVPRDVAFIEKKSLKRKFPFLNDTLWPPTSKN